MFQIGDIVWDITPEYKVLYFTGIIVNTGVVLGYPVFHVRFFHSFEEIISLQPHEIQRVS